MTRGLFISYSDDRGYGGGLGLCLALCAPGDDVYGLVLRDGRRESPK